MKLSPSLVFGSLCLFGMMIAGPIQSEVRTLTDLQSRTIKADVVSVENDIAKIKREDGLTFDLPLNKLSEADQKALREWVKAQENVIPAGAIDAVFGRAKFKSSKLPPESVAVSKTDGTIEIVDTINRTNEDWDYSVTLNNHLSKPLKNVRIEYRLFVKTDNEPGNDRKASALKRQTGSETTPLIAARDRMVFKTSTMQIQKVKLRGNASWGKTGGQGRIADALYGI